MAKLLSLVLITATFVGVQAGVYVGADLVHRKQESVSAYAKLTHRAKVELEALRQEEAYYEQLRQRHRRLADCLASADNCGD